MTSLPLLKNSGFTLIETAIYLGLFAVLMGFGLSSAFGLLESERRTSAQAALNEERNFLTAKITWLLSDLDLASGGVVEPAFGSGAELVVLKAGEPVPISLKGDGSDLVLTRGSGQPVALNGGGLRVERAVFTRMTANERPDAIGVSIVVSGRPPLPSSASNIEFTRYLFQ